MPRKKTTPSSFSRRASQSSVKLSRSHSLTQRKKPPGARALQEIRHFQKTVDFLIPRKSFFDVVKQVAAQVSYRHTFTDRLRFSKESLNALQEAAEAYLVNFFEDALLCTLHARRVTLMTRDFELTRQLRGPSEVCNR